MYVCVSDILVKVVGEKRALLLSRLMNCSTDRLEIFEID